MEVNIRLARGLQACIRRLFESGDGSDFTVIVEDTSYPCHTDFLGASSKFFHRLFLSKLKECLEGRVKLDRMTSNTFNVIIDAIYKGIDGLSEDNVLDVWYAVDLLQIGYLIDHCKKFLTYSLSTENCFRYLYHSVKYWPHAMCQVCLMFIINYFEQVKNDDNFLQLPFVCFYKVIKSDNLVTSSEDSVVETILKWVEYVPETLDEQTAEGMLPKAISLYSLGVGGNQEYGNNDEEDEHGYLEEDSDHVEENSDLEEYNGDEEDDDSNEEEDDSSNEEEDDGSSNEEEDDSSNEEEGDSSNEEEDDGSNEEEDDNSNEEQDDSNQREENCHHEKDDDDDQEEEDGDQEEEGGDQEEEHGDQEKENCSQPGDIFSRLQCAEIAVLRHQMRFGSSLERIRAIIKLRFSNHITRKSNCNPFGISLFDGASSKESILNPTRVAPADRASSTCQTVLIENRKQKFLKRISACRLFLARPEYLENMLEKQRDILVSTGAFSLVLKALMYTLNVGRRHDSWPEAAVHRDPSLDKHLMVFFSENKFKAYKLSTRSTHEFARGPEGFLDKSNNGRIEVFDNTLYFMYEDTDKGIIFRTLTQQKEWTLINYRGQDACSSKILLPHGSYIYDFKAENNNFVLVRYSCIHNDIRQWKKEICVGKTFGHCLIRFHQYIVVFGTNKNVVTAHYFNTVTEKTQICNTSMVGTSKGMKSFSCGEDVYILQRNGSLWKIFSTETVPINFEWVCDIWGFDCRLRGCVLYKKQLYIFCDKKNQLLFGKLRLSVRGIFDGIRVIQMNTYCVPMVLPQSWLD